ncbi:MAG: VWA domain-containing protein [Limnohabitans sp.]|uniref:VWA domain-containing protein n=1 Tax=Limnohabitans sp. TaxID=1907725 RepID=UPI00391A2F32
MENLMRNLMILAKWLAGRADIDVCESNGDTACIALINGRRMIQIPSHWSYTNDPEAAELLEGVIDHEALGHGRFTDLQGRAKAEDEGLITFNSLSSAIQNILEDVYIENKAIETYPGVKANLKRTVEILVGRGFFGSPVDFAKAQPAQLLTGAFLNVLRAKLVPGQDEVLKANVHALERLMPQAFGRLWDDVLAIAMEVKNSRCTADNIALTVRIMKLIESVSNDAANDQQKGAGGTSDSNEVQDSHQGQAQADEDRPSEEGAADGGVPKHDEDEPTGESSDVYLGEPADSGSGSSNEQASGKDGGLKEPGRPEGQGQGGSGNELAQPSQQSGLSGTHGGHFGALSEGYTQDEIDAARCVFEDRNGVMPQTEIGDAASQEVERVAQSGGYQPLPEVAFKTGLSPEAVRVSVMVKSAADELQDALRTETRCEKSTKLVGKSINSRVLSRVRLGNARIFRQKNEGLGLSTAVQFVVDMSGSMQDRLHDGIARLDAAVGLVYGMGDVLDEYEVPFQINAYSEVYASLKSFSEDWTQVRKRRERPRICGGTVTGMAVQRALCDMVVRQEERKLLVVITDGDTADLPVLMSCYAEAREMGIEIASVMIGPRIGSIDALASAFGFKATSINVSSGLGRFAVDRVLEAI